MFFRSKLLLVQFFPIEKLSCLSLGSSLRISLELHGIEENLKRVETWLVLIFVLRLILFFSLTEIL